jgi:hypothetical protein
LNFAPVAPTSAHTESIFSVVFLIWPIAKNMNVLFLFRPVPAGVLNPNSRIGLESRVPAIGAPAAGTVRKEILQKRAMLEAGAPEPAGR